MAEKDIEILRGKLQAFQEGLILGPTFEGLQHATRQRTLYGNYRFHAAAAQASEPRPLGANPGDNPTQIFTSETLAGRGIEQPAQAPAGAIQSDSPGSLSDVKEVRFSADPHGISRKHKGPEMTLEQWQQYWEKERERRELLDLKGRLKVRRSDEFVLVPQYEWIYPERHIWQPGEATRERAKFLVRNRFRRRHWGPHAITEDIPGQFRPPFRDEEEYLADLEGARQNGHQIATEMGRLVIAGQDCTVFTTNAEVKAGAAGHEAGTNIVHAAERATRRNEPLIGYIDSGGIYVPDGIRGLFRGMIDAPEEIRKFKEKTGKPFIVVMGQKVYGGIAGGVVPEAHVIVGRPGGEIGFAGDVVFRPYQGTPIPEGVQSVEAAVLDYRTVTVVARDSEQVQTIVERAIYHATNNHKLSRSEARRLPGLVEKPFVRYVGYRGLHNTLDQENPPEWLRPAGKPKILAQYPPKDLWEYYKHLEKDARRPDAEWLIYQMFDKVVPLYNNNGLNRPHKIFALGEIGGMSVLIAADQVSYDFDPETRDIIRLPANPTPIDRAIWQRILQFGQDCNLPLLSIIGTTGENSLPFSEALGLINAVSDSRKTIQNYRGKSVGIVIDGGGSGGFVASTPRNLHMVEDGQAYAAPPESGARIVFRNKIKKGERPTDDQIREYIQLSDSTAAELYREHLVQGVIYLPPEGPYENPLGMAQATRDVIALELAA